MKKQCEFCNAKNNHVRLVKFKGMKGDHLACPLCVKTYEDMYRKEKVNAQS